jgi:pimeloyl-ACP methyl ester carboxylesterase
MDVLLLHGLGADHRAFQRFRRLLPADWHVAAVDLLGHGDAPKPARGYRLDDLADQAARDVERLRADGTFPGGAPVVVVGHSYGAATGVALAARHPGLVERLVLLDPVLRLDGAADAGETRTQAMFRARRDGTLEQDVPRLFPENGDALNRWVVDTWSRMSPGVLEEFDNDWPRFAPAVRCPVTIVSGDVEQGGSGEAPATAFAGRAERVRIAGAGHYLHATHARETAAAVAAAATGAREGASAQ